MTLNSGIEIVNTVRMGIICPLAGVERLQKLIHNWINSPDPQGWDYQVNNDVIINCEILMSLPILNKPSFKILSSGELRGGTLFDDLSAGLSISTGNNVFDGTSIIKWTHQKDWVFHKCKCICKVCAL
jgi:hypothetical protein